MESSCNGINGVLHLEPFIHQVGGHSSLFHLHDDTICKPLLLQELKFYENCPESLKDFVPEFKGVVDVKYDIDADGYLNSTTSLPYSYDTEDKCLQVKRKEDQIMQRIKICPSGSVQIESNSKSLGSFQFGTEHSQLNPWVHRCHQELLKKITLTSTIFSQKYILLENLASRYECPCILDIKIGSRTYGHDASATKRKSQTGKAASTTTSSLGLRVMGIQVYQQDSGRYTCHNKYYGRTLTSSSFYEVLYNFFHNGSGSTTDILSQLIAKIQRLRDTIESLHNYRFFGSSLLIMYNGKKIMGSKCSEDNHLDIDKTAQDGDSVIVKLIDFAHSTLPTMHKIFTGCDDGCLFGLDNLIKQLKMLLQDS